MILSIDLGTSKLCAVALDSATGLPTAIRSRPNDTNIAGLPDDMHEQDPVRTVELALGLMKHALADESAAGQPVEAIGISGQMHGVLLVDRELRPLTNLVTWRDRRTARENTPGSISEALAAVSQEYEAITGCRLAVGYGAATLRWLDANRLLPPDCIALSIAGYLAARLTGVVAVDETHAASWGILDVAKNHWHEESITRLNLRRDALPPIKPSGAPLGRLTAPIADGLGISGEAVVCSPVGDAQSSVIGSVGFASDTIVINLGTGGQISIPRAEPVYTCELDAWPMPFGGYLQLGATLCGGWSYAYLKDFFKAVVAEIGGVDLSDEVIYERMVALAAFAAPGAGGLIADTRFSGTRKNKDITGSVLGIGTANLTPANLSLAVIEGIVDDLHSMLLSSGAPTARTLLASGNAVRRNPVLRSAIRRAFEMECRTPTVPEEAARGAGYAAAVGAGVLTRDQVTDITRRLVDSL